MYKPKRTFIDSMDKKYGGNLLDKYNSDRELFKSLKDRGLPSLAKLLKWTIKN